MPAGKCSSVILWPWRLEDTITDSTSGNHLKFARRFGGELGGWFVARTTVGRCRLSPGRPRIDRVWLQCLNLTYHETLSKFAFNFDLRNYTTVNVDVLRREIAPP